MHKTVLCQQQISHQPCEPRHRFALDCKDGQISISVKIFEAGTLVEEICFTKIASNKNGENSILLSWRVALIFQFKVCCVSSHIPRSPLFCSNYFLIKKGASPSLKGRSLSFFGDLQKTAPHSRHTSTLRRHGQREPFLCSKPQGKLSQKTFSLSGESRLSLGGQTLRSSMDTSRRQAFLKTPGGTPRPVRRCLFQSPP